MQAARLNESDHTGPRELKSFACLIKRERDDVFGYGVVRLVAGDKCVSHGCPLGQRQRGSVLRTETCSSLTTRGRNPKVPAIARTCENITKIAPWKESTVALLVYDLNLLKKRTVSLYCGACWKKHPKADKVLLAMITRSRTIHVLDDPYFELLAPLIDREMARHEPREEPKDPTPEEIAAYIVPAKESVARVFRVVRDPKPVDVDEVRAELEAQHPRMSLEELESEVDETVGPAYSTRSAKRGRLGMVEVVAWDEDYEHCKFECYNCGTNFVFDCTEAAGVAAHVNRYKGVGYATAKGLEVHGGKKPYVSARL